MPAVDGSQERRLTGCLSCALLLRPPAFCSLVLEHLPCCCSFSRKPSPTPPARPEASLTLFIVWKFDLPVRGSWGLPTVTTTLLNVQANLAVCPTVFSVARAHFRGPPASEPFCSDLSPLLQAPVPGEVRQDKHLLSAPGVRVKREALNSGGQRGAGPGVPLRELLGNMWVTPGQA